MKEFVFIGLSEYKTSFIKDCIDANNEYQYRSVTDYNEVSGHINNGSDDCMIIFIDTGIFCTDNYRFMEWMKDRIVYKGIPVICIGGIDGSTTSIKEGDILEHGASDVIYTFDKRVIRNRVSNILFRRNGSNTISATEAERQQLLQDKSSLINQLQVLMKNINKGITVASEEDGIVSFIYSNDDFFNTFGYTREEFNREFSGNLYDMVKPEYHEKIRKALKVSAEEEQPTQVVFEALNREGATIWIRANSSAHCFDTNGQTFYLTFYEDVTKMKKSEERIRTINDRLGNSEIFFQLDIVNQTVEAYHSIYEPENKISIYEKNNKVYEELMLSRIYHKDRKEALEVLSISNLMKHYQAGDMKLSVEYRRLFPQGETRWFVATAVLTEGLTEGSVNAFIYSHDVNEKVKCRIAKERVIDTDIENITLVNIITGTAQVIQVQKNCVIGIGTALYEDNLRKFIDNEVAEEDRERCRSYLSIINLISELDKKGSVELSYMVIKQDGTNRRQNCSITYLDSTCESLLFIGRDITTIYEGEQEQKMALQHAVDLANFANKAKSDFLARMSHDMRTPLNTILGIARIVKNTKDINEIKEYYKSINTAGEHLLRLINDTLDLNKIESGKMELNRERYPLDEFIMGINTVIRPLMDAKNIEFIVNLKRGVTNIVVDKMRFNQIFYNLLSNAAKYTKRGGKVEFWTEDIPPKNEKFGMRFYIRDNGIGMSKEYQKILFEPFSQEYGQSHKDQHGTGLGLAIVKQIVDLADGKINVRSELGKGTEFVVDLYAYNDESEIPVTKEPHYNNNYLHGIRVLLADDTEINAMILKEVLGYSGCEVDIAENGYEAVKLFSESEEYYYDIILTDLMMPKMDGIEEARRIREMNREDAQNIPIIAATADAYSDIYEKIKAVGINERLVKPIDPEILCETMIKLINSRKL